MRTYSKYIAKTIIPVLAVLTIVLTSLVWVIQLLNLVSLIDKGIRLKLFFKLALLLLPSLIFMIMPIISVVGVIYVYNRLQEDRQLIILRSSGLSNYQIAKPALLVAMIITFIALYISAYLMPVSYGNLKKNISDFKQNYVSNIIESRTFNQISKYVTVYIDKKTKHNEVQGVILFDNKNPARRSMFFAKKGEILNSDTNDTSLILSDGLRHSYDSEGNLTKLHFDNLVVEVNSGSETDSGRGRSSMELFIPQMLWPDDSFQSEKKQRLVAEGHSRIIWPLFNFTFVFLALSTFLRFVPMRKAQVKQLIWSFTPVLIAAYCHFTLQKIAYKDPTYILLCYANLLICIIYSLWQANRARL